MAETETETATATATVTEAEKPKKKTLRVWVPLDVTQYERFAIMKYFQPVDPIKRRRATRKQVKAFAVAAIKTAVEERVAMLKGRSKAAATRLKVDAPPKLDEQLSAPDESQRMLF